MPKIGPSLDAANESVIAPVSPRPTSAFMLSLPVTTTSFVNKCGDIGIRVFPMLLVEHAIPTNTASLIMALVKGTAVVAALAGGYLGDKLGHKATIVISFALAAAGMFMLPLSQSAVLICLAGMLTTFGQGLFTAPLRILLVHTVPTGKRQEALAWLRSGNNGAVMVANGIAYLTSGIGLAALFLFDALTSTIATCLGGRYLPNDKVSVKARPVANDAPPMERGSYRWRLTSFVSVSLILSFFTFQSELFFVATAAQAQMSFGARGVEVFSQVNLVNAVLCMVFAVYASRVVKSARFAFVFGLVLQTAGLALFALQRDKMSAYFIAVLLQTFGELAFTAVAQYVLLQIIPSGPREGRIYSVALVIQLSGKMLGGALAFFFLDGGFPWMIAVLVSSLFFVLLSLLMTTILARAKISF